MSKLVIFLMPILLTGCCSGGSCTIQNFAEAVDGFDFGLDKTMQKMRQY